MEILLFSGVRQLAYEKAFVETPIAGLAEIR